MLLHPRSWCPWRTVAIGLGIIVVVLVVSDEGHLRSALVAAVGLLVALPLAVQYLDWRFHRRRGEVPETPTADVYD